MRGRSRGVRRLAAVGLLCLAALPGCGGREDGERLGLASHMLVSDEPLRPQLDRIRGAGIGWIREDFPWARIEPSRGRFDWSRPDALMEAAAAAGLRVLAIADYSAPWASSGPDGEEHHPPRDPDRYAAYVRAIAERYGRGGRFWRGRPGDAVPLEAIELWNEPWGHFFWRPDPDPAAYARLVRAAATAVRDSGVDVRLLAAGDLLQVRTDGSVRPWLEELLRADPELPEVIDAWSIHPSPSPPDRPPADPGADPRFSFERVERIHELTGRAAPARPLWITELGWSTAQGPEGVSEEQQARYLGEALDRALGDWRDFVARVFVYTWDRSNGDPADREGNYGLRRADGSFKPAWDEIVRRAGGRR